MIIKPPTPIIKRNIIKPSVFLAGSIDNGSAIDWQAEMSEYFSDMGFEVFNPRRDDWDSTWEQTIENAQFYQQVSWELNALDHADLILMYFAPKSLSPISLLELGLFAKTGKIFVVCPKEFWRVGNVEIICERLGIPFFSTLEDFKAVIPDIFDTFSNLEIQ